MLSDAEEWGLLSVADVLESNTLEEDVKDAVPTYPVNDALFSLDDSACESNAASLAHRLVEFLKLESAAYITSIEETFKQRSQRVRQSLGASRRIREKLLTAVASFQDVAPASQETITAFGTITLLSAALTNGKAAYSEAVLYSISQIAWANASSSSCLEVLRNFQFEMNACSDGVQQRLLKAKLELSLQSSTLSALLQCMLTPGVKTVALQCFEAPLPALTSSVDLATFPSIETTLDGFLLRHYKLSSPMSGAAVGCFPQDTRSLSADGTQQSLASNEVAVLRQQESMFVACDERLTALEVAGMMGTRFHLVKSYNVPLRPGEKIISCNGPTVVTVQSCGNADAGRRYCVRQYTLPDEPPPATTTEDFTLPGITQCFICLNLRGLHVTSTSCSFSCCGGVLAVLLSAYSQNVAKRRLYVGSVALSQALSNSWDVQVEFRDDTGTLLRNPAGAANGRKALHFTKDTTVAIGCVTLKDRFHPFCVELWVYPRNATETQTIFSAGDKSADEVLIELDPSSDGVVWRGGARTPQLGSSFVSYNMPGKLSTSERWWHVALNFTGSKWELWLNCRLVASQTALVSPAPIRNARCLLGKGFVGFLAEVRVWSHVRTAAELARDSYRALTGKEEGLCGYFPLDERGGTVVADYSVNGQHVLVTPNTHPPPPDWCVLSSSPVAAPDQPRLVADFAPLARTEDVGGVFFCVSPYYYAVSVRTKRGTEPALCVFLYDRDTLVLRSETVLELPSTDCIQVQGICFNAAKQSTQCFGFRKDRPDLLVVWDMHEPSGIDFVPLRAKKYTNAWECSRDVLIQCARYSQDFLRSELYMLDESIWTQAIPAFAIDLNRSTLALLLRLAFESVAANDADLVHSTSTLLRANIMFRFESSPADLTAELGEAFASSDALLSVVTVQKDLNFTQSVPPFSSAGASSDMFAPRRLRDELVKLAFHPSAAHSGLLETLCRVFLSEESRTAFVKSVAGHSRGDDEEKLLACVLDYYGTLRASTDVLENPQLAQHLYTSLLLEATYLVERSLRHSPFLTLQRTSRCLEVFQEILFTQTSEITGMSRNSLPATSAVASSLATATREQVSFCISYTKTLLLACEKTINAVVSAIRKHPRSFPMLMRCLELSPVGALLPSFTVSLPFLPAIVLVTCATSMQACRGALSALAERIKSNVGNATDSDGVPGASASATLIPSIPSGADGGPTLTDTVRDSTRWLSELGNGLTFSLCLVGCSLLDASPPFGASESSALDENSSAAHLRLLRSGQRRAGSERDLPIKNLQQGVGLISKAFEEMQRADPTGLVVIRDEALRRMERNVMAAFCALLLPTPALKEATKDVLHTAYVHVQRLRPWILSQRQDSRESVEAVENRAAFLTQFECCNPASALQRHQQLALRKARSHGTNETNVPKEAATQHKWRSMFRNWKKMRVLKTLLSAQEENNHSQIASDITAFLQAEGALEPVERAVAWRSQKAHYRLSGLLLLRQLVEEARVNALLARIILPAMTKALCGWHYADGVDCCSGETMFRLQGAFFQLLEGVQASFLDLSASSDNADCSLQRLWAGLLTSLMTCITRVVDFRKVRGDLCRAVRLILGGPYGREVYCRRLGGVLPTVLRETKLSGGLAPSTMSISPSGLTLKATRNRGTCVAPCTWRASRANYTYYYEVKVVDILSESVCCIGVGPMDYGLSRVPGVDPGSCALRGDNGMLYCGSSAGRYTGVMFSTGDVIGCGWSVSKGRIYWTKNGNYVADADFTAATLSPLVGFEGDGVLLFNFGREPFVFTGSKEVSFSDSDYSNATAPGTEAARSHKEATHARRLKKGLSLCSSVDNAWDAFRVFTIRACLGLAHASKRIQSSTNTASELASCVGHCLTSLGDELKDAYALVVARSTATTTTLISSPNQPRKHGERREEADAAFYLVEVLRHCATVTQLLGCVPKDIIARHATSLATALQTTVISALQSRRVSQPSHSQQRSATEVDVLSSLLSALFYTMNLVPPSTERGVANAEEWIFLPLLLRLAARLSPLNTHGAVVPGGGMTYASSPRVSSPTSATLVSGTLATPIPALLVGNAPVDCLWLALSLLQRLNQTPTSGLLAGTDGDAKHSDTTGSGSTGLEVSQTQARHAWTGALHDWIMASLKGGAVSSPALADAILALAILSGGARLAAPGDCVHFHSAGSPEPSRGTLVSLDLGSETCSVTYDEGGARQTRTFPIRLVEVVTPDDDTSYFPITAAAHWLVELHAGQAAQVCALAQRAVDSVSTMTTLSAGATVLLAELFSVLQRCVARGVLELPRRFMAVLSRFCDVPADTHLDVANLRLRKVLCEYCRASRQPHAMMTSAGSRAGASPLAASENNMDGLFSTTTTTIDGEASTRDGFGDMSLSAPATLSLVDPSMSGFGVDDHDEIGGMMERDDEEEDLGDEEDYLSRGEDEDGTEEDEENERDYENSGFFSYTSRDTRTGLPDGDYGVDDEAEDGIDATYMPGELPRGRGPSLTAGATRTAADAAIGVEESSQRLTSSFAEAISFSGGYLCLSSARPIGLNFTLDFHVRLKNTAKPQILFCHSIQKSDAWTETGGANVEPVHALVARVEANCVEFGVVELSVGTQRRSGTDTDADMSGFVNENAELCRCALPVLDVVQWVRLSFIQSGTTLSLFCGGVLQDSRKILWCPPGPLLKEDLFFGGSPLEPSAHSLIGDLRAIRLYGIALRPAMVAQLHGLNSSLSFFVESHLCLHVGAADDQFANLSRALEAVTIRFSAEGQVGGLVETPLAARRRRGNGAAIMEVDFSTAADGLPLPVRRRCAAHDHASNIATYWKKRRQASADWHFHQFNKSWRGLLAYYSAKTLIECLKRRGHELLQWITEATHLGPPSLPLGTEASPTAEKHRLVDRPISAPNATAVSSQLTPPALFPPVSLSTMANRLLQCALFAKDDDLSDSMSEALCSFLRCAYRTDSSPRLSDEDQAAALEFGNEAAKGLLRYAQREQQMRLFESAHPVKGSDATFEHDVHATGCDYYELFFDSRCVTSTMKYVISEDHVFNVVSRVPSYALAPFAVRMRRVCIDIRNMSPSPQWGYRMAVVCNCQPQQRSALALRALLSTVLTATYKSITRAAKTRSRLPFLWSGECVQQLIQSAKVNTGQTRRLALSCLTDLLMLPDCFPTPLPALCVRAMEELRRMAELHFRIRLTAERVQATQSRFTQVTTEAFTALQDTVRCLVDRPTANADTSLKGGARTADDGDATLYTDMPPIPSHERQDFVRRRAEQRALYRLRDPDGTGRVTVQKTVQATNLHLEWTPERVCVARNEGALGSAESGRRSYAASLIALTVLRAGRWYLEVQIGDVGDVFIGVVPSSSAMASLPPTSATAAMTKPMAYNGFLGMCQGPDGSVRRVSQGGTWHYKDCVGVVIDLDEKRCSFYVNGEDAGVGFPFGPDNDRAASAAGDGCCDEDSASETGMAYHPFFTLGSGETLLINFGAKHFEYGVPRGCLPLDPANLALGTVLPFNQLRAFEDLVAHLLSAGAHALPPFYDEEANPFAESRERSGPAHVSLHAVSGVEVNLLEVKNPSPQFQTVAADCAVSGGCWYFEVTLRTQGLMQIGWVARRPGKTLPISAPGSARHGTAANAAEHSTDDSGGVAEDDNELSEGGSAFEDEDNSSVGDSALSWSVDLFRRVKWHDARSEAVTVQRRWGVGDVIGCALDLVHGEMSFSLNGRPIFSSGGLSRPSMLPSLHATFTDLPTEKGLLYTPAVSLRSGNHVTFNFGSSPLKYKPEGFSALGVSDSWIERMDTFYANENTSITSNRLRTLTRLCMQDSPFEQAAVDRWNASLAPAYRVVLATDAFCEETHRKYTQLTESDLQTYMQKDGSLPPSPSTATKGPRRHWEVFQLLMALARVTQAAAPFIHVSTQHPGLITRLFLAVRYVLFKSLRTEMVAGLLKETTVRTDSLRIGINRVKARRERHVFLSSVFGQTYSLLAKQSARIFQTSKRFWSTSFLGEGAEDVGGPFREHISEMCEELMSTNLPLFVPTANHTHNVGTHREAFVPSAAAISPLYLSAYVFLGSLMGGAIRSGEPLSLMLPPLVWKYLCGSSLGESDLGDVDSICLQCVREFRQLQEQSPESQEAFEDVFDNLFFATKLSDHSTRELIPGGASVRVTYERCVEYAEALLHARLHEFDLQLSKIREGLVQTVPEMVLLLLTPAELEQRVCGQADYAVEDLQKGAIFEGVTSEDRRVQLLWRALQEATPRQRRQFLRFVSGRDRMPIKLRILPLASTTQSSSTSAPQSTDADLLLPRAATCFFAVELPDYSTLEVMKQKLYYSIENCADIDTDFRARASGEDDGPNLTINVDGARPQDDVGGSVGDGGNAGGPTDD